MVYEHPVTEEKLTLLQTAWCSIPFTEESYGSLYMMLGSTLVYFFAPIVIVTLLYSK